MARLPLSRGKYGVGVSWDRGPHGIDIDLQAVIVNTRGSIIDAVYYPGGRRTRADAPSEGTRGDVLGSITHSGDEQTGEKEKQVKLVIFVVAAYSGGSLRDAPNLSMHILEETPGLAGALRGTGSAAH
ncbi:unnamed protein product [Prorocentrum cordatum]|uniref:TerD domain-containing protein n=1 Tax=Prorocentrum cordatum TaxID=2364126 RepID=A0ABN9TE32_9DINO|nr:unnamed protein product [Polarella glacialis]